MANDLSKIIDKMVKDSEKIARKALGTAVKQIQKDLENKAKSCIDMYYSNYKPKRYHRTKQLYKALKSFAEIDETGADVGIEFDYSAMKQHKSNSKYHQSGDAWKVRPLGVTKGQFGTPENDWIMEKFLIGEHPWAQLDSITTDDVMSEYTDMSNAETEARVQGYLVRAMEGILTKRLFK